MDQNVFICVTPFQVFSSVAIAEQINVISDIIISDLFAGYEEIADRLKQLDLFRKVIVVREEEIWLLKEKNYIKKELSVINTYIKIKEIANRYFPRINEYTDVFSPGRKNVLGKIIYNYVSQYNINSRIHFYDEGTGIYSNSSVDIKRLDLICTRLFVGKKAAKFDYDLYLFSPDCYRYINPNRDTKIKQITISDNAKRLLWEIFPERFNIPQDTEAIIFDVLYDQEFNQEGKEKYTNILSHITKKLSCVIKKHPRETSEQIVLQELKCKLPFEIMWATGSVKDKVLISPFSTALFTPKMIYNDEPIIIFLYKLLEGTRKNESEASFRLLNWVKKSYLNQNRVIIPDSLETLDLALDEIKENNNTS